MAGVVVSNKHAPSSEVDQVDAGHLRRLCSDVVLGKRNGDDGVRTTAKKVCCFNHVKSTNGFGIRVVFM